MYLDIRGKGNIRKIGAFWRSRSRRSSWAASWLQSSTVCPLRASNNASAVPQDPAPSTVTGNLFSEVILFLDAVRIQSGRGFDE
jgi:hypothetical protein